MFFTIKIVIHETKFANCKNKNYYILVKFEHSKICYIK